MRENYDTSGPGKYEGESPMVAYLDDHSEYADEESGDVESPTGFFARYGKWILRTDSNGFTYGGKESTAEDAANVFAAYEEEYSRWADDDEVTR